MIDKTCSRSSSSSSNNTDEEAAWSTGNLTRDSQDQRRRETQMDQWVQFMQLKAVAAGGCLRTIHRSNYSSKWIGREESYQDRSRTQEHPVFPSQQAAMYKRNNSSRSCPSSPTIIFEDQPTMPVAPFYSLWVTRRRLMNDSVQLCPLSVFRVWWLLVCRARLVAILAEFLRWCAGVGGRQIDLGGGGG